MDDAGVSHATILGASEGAAMGALVAASLPARVDSLVLAMGLVYGPFCAHHPKPESGRRFGEWMLDRLGASWGTGQAMGMWVDGPGTAPPLETVQRLERYMFTPRGVVEVMARNMEIDVRPVLPVLDLPTLVVHATGDSLIPSSGRVKQAAAIPHAVGRAGRRLYMLRGRSTRSTRWWTSSRSGSRDVRRRRRRRS